MTKFDDTGDSKNVKFEKIAFKMYLNAGMVKEYKKRHDLIDDIQPKLKQLLTDSGIKDYSIFEIYSQTF